MKQQFDIAPWIAGFGVESLRPVRRKTHFREIQKLFSHRRSREPGASCPNIGLGAKLLSQGQDGRCEAIDDGHRCVYAEPKHRMFADHIVKLFDGGSPFDPANGQCLCARHHSLKTARARQARFRAQIPRGMGV
jgi:hypothetical protein